MDGGHFIGGRAILLWAAGGGGGIFGECAEGLGGARG